MRDSKFIKKGLDGIWRHQELTEIKHHRKHQCQSSCEIRIENLYCWKPSLMFEINILSHPYLSQYFSWDQWTHFPDSPQVTVIFANALNVTRILSYTGHTVKHPVHNWQYRKQMKYNWWELESKRLLDRNEEFELPYQTKHSIS